MHYAATIGFFDGVHIGHQSLLQTLHKKASANGLATLVFTFNEHPLKVFNGEDIKLINTLEERVELLKDRGIERVVVLDWKDIKDLTAREFMTLMRDQYNVRLLEMGFNHKFGSDQNKKFDFYKQLGIELGIEVYQDYEMQNHDGEINSTRIRKFIEDANFPRAYIMLGNDKSYLLTGKVVQGNQIGRTIGYPTANIDIAKIKILPLDGVYYGRAILEDGRILKALINIGTNPTIGEQERTVEAYILDFNEDIYNQTISIKLLYFLRYDKKFASLEELKQQIKKDIAMIG